MVTYKQFPVADLIALIDEETHHGLSKVQDELFATDDHGEAQYDLTFLELETQKFYSFQYAISPSWGVITEMIDGECLEVVPVQVTVTKYEAA